MVIMVLGLPGSGKSYFACRLAKMIGAEYVNSDVLRKKMFPQRTYSDREKAAVYSAMLASMKESLKHKKNMVLDATFHKEETRLLFKKEMHEKDSLFFIEVEADEALVKQRLQTERPDSEADFEVYKLVRGQWEPLNEPHLLLRSTDENISSLLQQAAEYLPLKK